METTDGVTVTNAEYVPSPIMQYFNYTHLPEGKSRNTSESVYFLAQQLDRQLPNSAEKSAGLRKLLEAKDCFVRAAL